MAVVIRLKRIGAKKRPFYRIVVTDSKNPRDGRFIEEIGTYEPRKDPPFATLKKGRAEYWASVGARPSATVKSLLKKQGVRL